MDNTKVCFKPLKKILPSMVDIKNNTLSKKEVERRIKLYQYRYENGLDLFNGVPLLSDNGQSCDTLLIGENL